MHARPQTRQQVQRQEASRPAQANELTPRPSPLPHPLLELQRRAGNQAVVRFIQTKLKTGAPKDICHQEANRVAEMVTRAPEQAAELIRELEKMGATVFILPTVSFAPPQDWSALDAALAVLGEFDWLLLTSQNAVRFFARRCGEKRIDVAALADGNPCPFRLFG